MAVVHQPVPQYRGVWATTQDGFRQGIGDEGGEDSAEGIGGTGDAGGGAPRLPEMGPGRRPGGSGKGGRPLGTGRNTRKTLRQGYARALAIFLQATDANKLFVACGVDKPGDAHLEAIDQYVMGALHDGPYRGQVWPVDAVVGAVARFNLAEMNAFSDPMLVCCWVSSRGNVACTCIQSIRYEASLDPDRRAVPHADCDHATDFLHALRALADALEIPADALLSYFGALGHDDTPTGPVGRRSRSRRPRQPTTALDEVEVFDTGGLPIAVVLSGVGIRRVPAPVKCARKATSCCYCVSSRASSCTHVLSTRHLRQGDIPRTAAAGGTAAQGAADDGGADGALANGAAKRKAAQTSISRLRLSPFDCRKSILVDVEIFDHARRKESFIIKVPKSCSACGTDRGGAELQVVKDGVILSHMGFCSMVLQAYDCSSCGRWVCADGREQGVVILSSCTAASVSLVRHFCQEVAVEGDAFSKMFRSWWVKARGRSRAGVFPRLSQSRSRRTVSRLMSAGLRLMSMNVPHWCFDCSRCCVKGRYRVVTADGIWLGYLRRLITNYYEHYSERCDPNKDLLAAASLVASEWVRRFIRLCVTHPEQAITVAGDQRRSAISALAILCPTTLPDSMLWSSLAVDPVALRVRAMLADVWHLPTCVVQLVKGLLAATTKTIAAAVAAGKPQAETAADRELQGCLRAWLTTPRLENRHLATAALPVPAAAAPIVAPPAPLGDGLPGAGPVGGGPAGVNVAAAAGGGGGGGQLLGGGVAPAAPDGARRGLLPRITSLPENMVPGLVSFCVALVVDPVVSPFKPHHVGPLRSLAALLRDEDAADKVTALCHAASQQTVTEESVPVGTDYPLVLMVWEVQMLLVFLTSLKLLDGSLFELAFSVAAVLDDVCERIEAYHAAALLEPNSAALFQYRWAGDGKTPQQMREFFLSQFPNASDDPLVTGLYFPGRLQCRATAFAATEQPDTGTCAKNYQAARKSFTPGAFLICCACSHPRVLGFVVLDKREGPPALLNTIISRFAVLPEYIIYDFGCGAVRSTLTKLPWLLRDSTVTSDEFHVVNHVCSIALDPRSFLTLNKANTVAHEQRNRAIKLLSRVLRASGQTEYTRVLSYHTFIHNIRAHARLAFSNPLPEVYDFGRFFFSREACLCGCGFAVTNPFAVDDLSGSDDSGASSEPHSPLPGGSDSSNSPA